MALAKIRTIATPKKPKDDAPEAGLDADCGHAHG